MSASSTTRIPAGAISRGTSRVDDRAAEKPVVLWAFAKLVVLIGALALLTPMWLNMLGGAATSEQPDSWIAVRVLVVTGSVSLFAVGAIVVKVWADLLKHLARAD